MKLQNITVLSPESEFTDEQLQKLSFAGKVSFMDSKRQSSLKDLIKISRNADILAYDPTFFGKYASRYLSEILKASPQVKGLALNSTTDDYVCKQYCEDKNISISVVRNPAFNAIAEFTILLLLGAARKIFINGWQAQKKMYKWELGSELWGKRLGIIGMEHIGQRIAVIAKAFGMMPYIWDKDIVRFEEARRQSSVEGVLSASDMIVINLPDIEENKKILSKERLDRLREGMVIINLSGRGLVDEKAMVQALQTGRVSQYVYEVDRIKPSPLDKIENALAFKKLSGHTHESLARSKALWVKNISDLAGYHTS